MEREYTVDDRIDRLTMREGIFCEANVAGSGCCMETEMWNFKRRWVKDRRERGRTRTFCGDIELCLCLVVPRRVRHERRVGAGRGRRGGGEEEEEERKRAKRDLDVLFNGFLCRLIPPDPPR